MSITADNIKASSFKHNLVIYNDTKAISVDAGAFNSGSWVTRTLNTTVYSNQTNGTWASLSSNTITLQPGKYYIEAYCPCYNVGYNAARLYNVTDTTVDLESTMIYAANAAGTTAQGSAHILGIVEITSAKDFRIEHRCAATKTINGLGIESFYTDSLYTTIVIFKLK